MLADIESNPQGLKFIRFDVLGSNKDMSNPKDRKNVKKKSERGVIGYNVYDYYKGGIRYRIGLEVIKKKQSKIAWEEPYYIKSPKKKKKG